MNTFQWDLCFVADLESAGSTDLLYFIQEAVEGGVTLVQLRAKNLSARKFLHLSLRVSRYLRSKNIPLVVNDRTDIAFSCESQGVHLGQDDLPLPYARKILGKNKWVGISVNTVQEALDAESQGADYLGVGPIFSTPSKKDARSALGLEGFQSIRKSTGLPILAIGGIHIQNAGEIIAQGADGVAVISALMSSSDVRTSAQQLRQIIKKARSQKLD
ncbi:thiamine phosphate synthase [bacterium]|nr:thiamine phosphate synthase [bacterium]